MPNPFPNQAFQNWVDQDLPMLMLLWSIFDKDFEITSPATWAKVFQEEFSTPETSDEGILNCIGTLVASHVQACSSCDQPQPVSADNLAAGRRLCYRCNLHQDRRDWLPPMARELPAAPTWENYQDQARALAQGDREQALEAYDEAIRLKPDEADLYLQRGQLHANVGNKEQALADFSHLLLLRTGTPELYVLIAETLSDTHFPVTDILTFLDQALRLDPGYAPAWYAKGQALLGDDKNQALAWAEDTIARFPHLPWGYILKADVLQRQQQLDEALASSARAIAADPRCPEAYGIEAHILRRLERFQEALASLSRLISLRPAWYFGNLHRRLLWHDLQMQRGEFTKEAWGIYQDQQKLLSFNLYTHPGLRPAILECYSRQLETPGEDSWLLFLLRGRLLETVGEWEAALDDYALSLELNPRFPRTWLHHGTCLISLGRPREALEPLTRFTTAEPYYEEGFYQLSRCYQALDDLHAARLALQHALTRSPFHAQSHYALAMSYLPADPALAKLQLQQFSLQLQARLDAGLHFTVAHMLQREQIKSQAAATLCQRQMSTPWTGQHPQAPDWIREDPVLAPLHQLAEEIRQGGQYT